MWNNRTVKAILILSANATEYQPISDETPALIGATALGVASTSGTFDSLIAAFNGFPADEAPRDAYGNRVYMLAVLGSDDIAIGDALAVTGMIFGPL